MPTATKKKPVPAPQECLSIELKPEAPKTVKQQVAAALEKYFELENAVHADYLLDGETEIGAARENLCFEIDGIEEQENEVVLEDVQAFIKVCDAATEEEILEALDTDSIVAYMRDKLDAFADADLREAVKGEFHCCVRIESLVQRDKLEEFLRAEIWPADNLYRENVIL